MIRRRPRPARRKGGAAAMLGAGLALLAAAAPAEERRLSAAEFESYVTGRTLFYAGPGQAPYGAEEYLSGRQVIWTFLDGNCVKGFWYEKAEGLICFIYEEKIEPQCWSFWSEGEGISAQFETDAEAVLLFELSQSEQPLTCQGPEVGV